MHYLSLCLFVNSFSQKIYIRLLKVFWIWLRTFNLQKLMQFNFRGRFAFRYKGQKLGFSWFFQKILPSDFLGLFLNKSSCNSYCKPCVKKTLRSAPKCFWLISLPDLQKSNISLWKSIDSHLFKNVLFELFHLHLCLFFFLKMIKLYK